MRSGLIGAVVVVVVVAGCASRSPIRAVPPERTSLPPSTTSPQTHTTGTSDPTTRLPAPSPTRSPPVPPSTVASSSCHAPPHALGPADGGWAPTAASPLTGRDDAASAWTGTQLLVWGGNATSMLTRPTPSTADGASYDPATNSWCMLPPAPLSVTGPAVGAWTGSEFVVWSSAANAGAAFTPASRRWRTMPRSPLSERYGTSTVWTGKELIVWGGFLQNVPRIETGDDGAAFDPSTRTWRLLPPGPSRRGEHLAVWDGNAMLVWGGGYEQCGPDSCDQGARADGMAYDPQTNSWRPMSASPLSARSGSLGAWDGAELLVIGGASPSGGSFAHDGAAYDPAADRWRQIAPVPLKRWVLGGRAVWTGASLFVWDGGGAPVGGSGGGADYESLTFSPATDRWQPVPASGLGEVENPAVVWTGRDVIVWGGAFQGVDTHGARNIGARYR